MKIITDIDIIPSIIVQIGHGDTQSVSEAALINAGLAVTSVNFPVVLMSFR